MHSKKVSHFVIIVGINMKLNITKTIKLTSEMESELKEISEDTGFKQTDLIRHLLNRSLEQLKSDKIRAGGYDKLEITLRKT